MKPSDTARAGSISRIEFASRILEDDTVLSELGDFERTPNYDSGMDMPIFDGDEWRLVRVAAGAHRSEGKVYIELHKMVSDESRRVIQMHPDMSNESIMAVVAAAYQACWHAGARYLEWSRVIKRDPLGVWLVESYEAEYVIWLIGEYFSRAHLAGAYDGEEC
jgi:hypothetical protein